MSNRIYQDWELKKLEEICDLQAGKFIAADAISPERNYLQYPCYGGNGLRGYVNSFSHDGNYPIIGRQGALCGNVNKVSGKFYATEHAVVATSFKNVDTDWLFFGLTHLNLNQYATGAAQPGLSVANIKKVSIPLPSLPEQKAIAGVLSTWDKTIDTMERLIEAKRKVLKGNYNKYFSEHFRSIYNWDTVSLGDLFEEVTDKVKSKKLVPHSISAGIGFVSQQEKWGKDISGEQYQNYIHLRAGEFAYNKGNSKRYKQGCIYFLKEGEICVPNVFICFKGKEHVVNEFYAHYFIADCHAQELKKFITSGARSDGLLNVSKDGFFKIKVPLPNNSDQQKIAGLLDVLNEEILILNNILEKYKKQKRGLMQKLLTGEWRVVK